MGERQLLPTHTLLHGHTVLPLLMEALLSPHCFDLRARSLNFEHRACYVELSMRVVENTLQHEPYWLFGRSLEMPGNNLHLSFQMSYVIVCVLIDFVRWTGVAMVRLTGPPACRPTALPASRTAGLPASHK